MTVEVIVQNGMINLRSNGVGNEHLRHGLWEIFGKICRQESISAPKFGGMVEFEFKRFYKMQGATQQTTLGDLRIEHLSKALSIVSRVLIKHLNSRVTDCSPYKMTTTKDGLGIEEVTAKAM